MTNPTHRPTLLTIIAGLGLIVGLAGCSQETATEPAVATSPDTATTQPSAEDGQGRRRPATGRWFLRDGVAEALELDDEQIAALTAIGDTQVANVRDIRKTERRAFLRFIRSLNEEPRKPERVAMTRQELEAAVVERTRQATASLMEIRDVLSKDQWEKIPQVAPGVLQMGSFRYSGSAKTFISDEDPADVTGEPRPPTQ